MSTIRINIMKFKVYLLLAVCHHMQIEQRQLQEASGLGKNTFSLWKVWKRKPTVESFYRAQCALIELAGLPDEYKDLEIEAVARIVIK